MTAVRVLPSVLTAAVLAAGCGGTTAPTYDPPPTIEVATPTAETSAAPTEVPTEAPPVVRSGAYCSPSGATGTTARGTPMECTRRPGERRPRWRQVTP